MYRKKTPITFYWNLCPFVILSIKIVFALKFKTVEDAFTNFGTSTSINNHQTVCKEQAPYPHLHFSWNYALL